MSFLLGFPAHEAYRFYLGGRHCRVNPDGVETLALLTTVYRAYTSSDKPSWALPLRDDVRRIQLLSARSVLSLVIDRTPDPKLRILAIWLRGRCGGYIGTSVLANFTSCPDFQTRKETARALKRMSGWSHLAKMAASDTDARIRRIATPAPAKPYQDRLAKFSHNVRHIKASTERRHLWVLPSLRVNGGKPLKSATAIRLVLERIHRLVTGQQHQTEQSSQGR